MFNFENSVLMTQVPYAQENFKRMAQLCAVKPMLSPLRLEIVEQIFYDQPT